MIDPILDRDMELEERRFNNIILNGLRIKNDIELLDQILKAVVNKRESELSKFLEYTGYDILTPIDDFNLILEKAKSVKQTIDISINDVRLYRLNFIFDGKKIENIVTLLAQQHDNSVRISGNKIYLAPVWTDPIISPGPSGQGMFIKFYGGKYNANTLLHTVIFNGEVRHVTTPKIEKFYNITKSTKDIDKRYRYLDVPLPLYSLLRYSLREAIEKYGNLKFGIDFIISDGRVDSINLAEFDCITTRKEQIKRLSPYPERHDVHIYIRKDSNIYNYKMAYAIIYAFDALPKRAEEIMKGIDTTKEMGRWRILIATLAFKDSYNSSGLLEALYNHINKIESFIDSVTKEQLEELGIYVNDIYDFTAFLVKNYDEINRAAKVYSNIFKNKRLELLYYVMFNIIVNVNKTVDELNKAVSKAGQLNHQHFMFKLKDNSLSKAIYSVVNSRDKILPVYQFMTVNDNRITKLSMTEIQDRADGVKRPSGKSARNKQFPASVKILNGYALYMGSALHYPKNCPTPLRTMNPFTKFKPNGGIDIPPDLEKEIIAIDKLLRNELTEEEEIKTRKSVFEDHEAINE